MTTVGYVACAFIACLSWWHKPQDPEIQIDIDYQDLTKEEFERLVDVREEHSSNGATTTSQAIKDRAPSVKNTLLPVDEPGVELITKSTSPDSVGSRFQQSNMKQIGRMISGRAYLTWSCFIMSVFGAIHCVAWNFHFPTLVESMMWKIASIFHSAAIRIILVSLEDGYASD